nr:immunoglobulin heavy chain junction region [Mus musculus]
CTRWEEGYW